MKEYETKLARIFCLTSPPSGTFTFLYNQILSLAKILLSFGKKKILFHILYHSVPWELAHKAAGKPGLCSFCSRAACSLSCPEASAKVSRGFLLLCIPSVLRDLCLILHKLSNGQLTEPWRLEKFRAHSCFIS